MAIVVNLDVMMAKRKMSLNELSEKVDITLANTYNTFSICCALILISIEVIIKS